MVHFYLMWCDIEGKKKYQKKKVKEKGLNKIGVKINFKLNIHKTYKVLQKNQLFGHISSCREMYM